MRRKTLGGHRRLAALIGSAGLALFLGACASSSDGNSPLEKFFAGGVSQTGSTVDNPDYDQDYFLKSGYCPPVQVRSGTEALIVYERGHEEEAEFIRYQGSINKTARECGGAAGQMSIKLGVAGRAVAGPKGGAGTVTLPIRVAVAKQSGGVLFSEIFRVQVTISPPDLGTNFSQVIEQITFPITPEDRDLLIYVGFDEGNESNAATG
jgi:hypothetical protein